jgi:hypothetical protein
MHSAEVTAMEMRFEKKENAPRSKRLLSIVAHPDQNRCYHKRSGPCASYGNISGLAMR